jgi:hypothetical protein
MYSYIMTLYCILVMRHEHIIYIISSFRFTSKNKKQMIKSEHC